jgi:ABC-type transport system involved in multi-copper enzyme maturation permease subunit
MRALHNLLTVARFERKTLLRSWFFRIFAAMFIVGIGIFNLVVFLDNTGVPWIYRALPASLPYANLIILNLGQAVVAVFLASEFLKQDRKNDTVEVIYVRSMTNFEYVFGKTLGILTVFLLLNLIILIIGIGFSFISADSAKGVAEFFLYPILISLPTLTFILGLSFFLMSVLRNQAITFILILGYIALTVFYLNDVYYHLFDYIGYRVPLLSSTIGGFGNLSSVILHRGVYFLTGLGFVFFTVFKLNRLPQTPRNAYLPLIFATVLFISGAYLGFRYISQKKDELKEKQAMVELNNKFIEFPLVSITEYNIDLKHNNNYIEVNTTISVNNINDFEIDTLLFSLNPTLEITSIHVDGKEVEYYRDLHLVFIPNETLRVGSSKTISFSYSGSINESTHFLDIHPDEYDDNLSMELFRAHKRFAYVTPNFVCLTSESLWYPLAGVTYATDKPAFQNVNFAQFSLSVSTKDKLIAISQGENISNEKGVFKFSNIDPLPKISLLIGNYLKKSVIVDSVEYSIYTIKGNDYYSKQFKEIGDTLPTIIRELKNEYEALVGLNFGFKRLSLAEVPVNLSIDRHIYSNVSDAVQPEIIFYPEKGVLMDETDFTRRKKRAEKQMKSNNEEVTDVELQSRIFKRFVRANLMASPSEWFDFGEIMNRYTFSLMPFYYSYVTSLVSPNWPLLNAAMEVYLLNRYLNHMPQTTWFYRGISKSEKINLELQQRSMNEMLKVGKRQIDREKDAYNPLVINDIILAKGNQLFSILRSRFSDTEFNKGINGLIKKNQGNQFTIDELERAMTIGIEKSIANEVDNWYNSTTLPGYIISNLQTHKVLDGDYTKYQVRISISNPNPVDGIVEVSVFLDDRSNTRSFTSEEPRQPDHFQRIFLPAKSAKEVGVLFNSEPKRMNIFTGVSENLPNTIGFELSGFDELRRNVKLDGVVDIPFFDSELKENEFVVDNEDDGFEIVQQSEESYLKSLINKDSAKEYKYTGIHVWSPPNEWKPVLESGFYGMFIRSGYYTASGDGSRYVKWSANLQQGAYYDVFCHTAKINVYWGRDKRKSSYNYRVYHDDGVEDITLTDEELDSGWNYLGTYYISPENAIVELTNKSVGRMVFADAIKWVKK